MYRQGWAAFAPDGTWQGTDLTGATVEMRFKMNLSLGLVPDPVPALYRPACDQASRSSSQPARPQPSTTSQGGSFQAISASSATSARPKSRGPRMAPVQTG